MVDIKGDGVLKGIPLVAAESIGRWHRSPLCLGVRSEWLTSDEYERLCRMMMSLSQQENPDVRVLRCSSKDPRNQPIPARYHVFLCFCVGWPQKSISLGLE